MTYIVKELRKEELLRLLLAGYRLKEAAAYMKVTYWTVNRYLKESDFMDQLRAANEDIWKEVDAELKGNKLSIVQRAEEAAEEALEEMITLAKSAKQEGVRLKAAQDLMDRDTRISRTRRIEDGGDRRPLLNAVVLQQAITAAREEDAVVINGGRVPGTPTPKETSSKEIPTELPPEKEVPNNQVTLFASDEED